MNLSTWDIIQGIGSIIALISVELAGRTNVPARFWAWVLIITAHLTILFAGIVLGLEGLYILNVGMIIAGVRNIVRDKKTLKEFRILEQELK
jgi:hypothetical protein